jgi:hypothetical protein
MSTESKKPTLDEVAERAGRGENVDALLGLGAGRMRPPRTPQNAPQRVNVDFTPEMLSELDGLAESLNVSRQAVIKMMLRHGLDQHFLARQAKRGSVA